VIAENVDDAVLRRAEHDGTLALHAGDPPHGRPAVTAMSSRPMSARRMTPRQT
jgi:hypothetical protein